MTTTLPKSLELRPYNPDESPQVSEIRVNMRAAASGRQKVIH
ncbi:hypothetical protein [Rouxiella badensis]|nr:hypothetical protein [Rouxiella badensis]